MVWKSVYILAIGLTLIGQSHGDDSDPLSRSVRNFWQTLQETFASRLKKCCPYGQRFAVDEDLTQEMGCINIPYSQSAKGQELIRKREEEMLNLGLNVTGYTFERDPDAACKGQVRSFRFEKSTGEYIPWIGLRIGEDGEDIYATWCVDLGYRHGQSGSNLYRGTNRLASGIWARVCDPTDKRFRPIKTISNIFKSFFLLADDHEVSVPLVE